MDPSTSCPTCGAAVPVGASVCAQCGADVAPPSAGPIGRRRAPTAIPRGLTIVEAPTGLTFVRPWWRLHAIPLLAFAGFWNLSMLGWLGFAYALGAWVMALFGALQAVLGLALGYAAFAMVVNRTTVRLSDGHLLVHHGPLPWRGGVDLPAAGLDQLWATERVIRGERGLHRSYALMATLNDGRDVELVRGLETPADARAMEERIERALGISDREMPREVTE